MSFITAQELRDFKVRGKSVCLTNYNNDELDDEIQMVSDLIEWYTGTVFRSVATTVYLNGNGTHWLKLWPELNGPLISVSSLLYVDNNDTTLDTLTQNTDFVIEPYALVKPMRPDLNLNSPRLTSGIDSTLRWVKGYRNYKATLTYGRASVPLEVKKAVKILTSESLMPGITGLQRDDVYLERWEDYTIQYRDSQRTPTPDPSATLGFPAVDRLLDRYRIHPDMFLDIPDIPSSVNTLVPISDMD